MYNVLYYRSFMVDKVRLTSFPFLLFNIRYVRRLSYPKVINRFYFCNFILFELPWNFWPAKSFVCQCQGNSNNLFSSFLSYTIYDLQTIAPIFMLDTQRRYSSLCVATAFSTFLCWAETSSLSSILRPLCGSIYVLCSILHLRWCCPILIYVSIKTIFFKSIL